jgi:hypothetical protein
MTIYFDIIILVGNYMVVNKIKLVTTLLEKPFQKLGL